MQCDAHLKASGMLCVPGLTGNSRSPGGTCLPAQVPCLMPEHFAKHDFKLYAGGKHAERIPCCNTLQCCNSLTYCNATLQKHDTAKVGYKSGMLVDMHC